MESSAHIYLVFFISLPPRKSRPLASVSKLDSFFPLKKLAIFFPTFTTLFKLPDLNLMPEFLSFEYGTSSPLCWGFLCSFIFAFVSPSFWRQNEHNLLRAQHKPWQAAQRCQHGLHNTGAHSSSKLYFWGHNHKTNDFQGITGHFWTYRLKPGDFPADRIDAFCI